MHDNGDWYRDILTIEHIIVASQRYYYRMSFLIENPKDETGFHIEQFITDSCERYAVEAEDYNIRPCHICAKLDSEPYVMYINFLVSVKDNTAFNRLKLRMPEITDHMENVDDMVPPKHQSKDLTVDIAPDFNFMGIDGFFT